MKENSINKQIVSKERGITLISLIITVLVLLVLASISISTGTESLDATRLQGFYMQLETIQKKADDIAITNEIYINNNGDTINTKTHPDFILTEAEKTKLQEILSKEESLGLNVDEFRYFSIEELDKVLDLIEMEHNVFIHFATRTVISEEGITVKEVEYHMLKNNMYFPSYNANKNTGNITLSYEINTYETDKYKIKVTPTTVGDLDTTGILKYKKAASKYWELAGGLEIIVSELTQYNIEYTDNNKNTAKQTITILLDDNENPIYIVNE